MPLLLLLSPDDSLRRSLDEILAGHFPGLTLLRFDSDADIAACQETLGGIAVLLIDTRSATPPPGKPPCPILLIVPDASQAPDSHPALALPLRPVETRSLLRLLLHPSPSTPENRLSRGRKFEAIARFQSGLAHDLNNRLTTLLGNLEFLPGLLPDAESQLVDDMRRAAGGAVQLIRQIQTFSHRDPLPAHAFSLTELLRDCLDLASRLCGDACGLELFLPEDNIRVYSDESLIEQVLFSWLAVCSCEHPRLRLDLILEPEHTCLRLSVSAGQILLPGPCEQLPELCNSREILREAGLDFQETPECFELRLPNA